MPVRWQFPKDFFVSPFFDRAGAYGVTLSQVGDSLSVTLTAMSDASTPQPSDPQIRVPAGWTVNGPMLSSQTQVSIINGQATRRERRIGRGFDHGFIGRESLDDANPPGFRKAAYDFQGLCPATTSGKQNQPDCGRGLG